jgi:hypothetical protein
VVSLEIKWCGAAGRVGCDYCEGRTMHSTRGSMQWMHSCCCAVWQCTNCCRSCILQVVLQEQFLMAAAGPPAGVVGP